MFPLIKIKKAKEQAASIPQLIPAKEKMMPVCKNPEARTEPRRIIIVEMKLFRLGASLVKTYCKTILIHVNCSRRMMANEALI